MEDCTMAAVTESMNVLLINDMCGFGKVALSAMMPVLSHMGFRLHNLPTALVSNTLNYPDFFIQDTTDYVKKTLPIWDELGFEFDAVSTGFIVTEEEARVIAEFCERQAAKGVRVFVDPIMGDNGSLYAGVPESTVALMRRLVAQASVTVPNYTEACLLTGTPIDMERGLTAEGAKALVDAVRNLGARSVVVTSAKVDGTCAVVGYDAETGEYFTIPFEEVPVYFPGTGDIFSSVLLGRVLKGLALREATANAMDVVRELIVRNADQEDKPRGIPIEACLDVLDREPAEAARNEEGTPNQADATCEACGAGEPEAAKLGEKKQGAPRGKRPKIRVTVVDQLGECSCHHGHKPGDVFDYDRDRGALCPMAANVGFPYIDILRYGGQVPGNDHDTVEFCCPERETLNVFRAEIVQE